MNQTREPSRASELAARVRALDREATAALEQVRDAATAAPGWAETWRAVDDTALWRVDRLGAWQNAQRSMLVLPQSWNEYAVRQPLVSALRCQAMEGHISEEVRNLLSAPVEVAVDLPKWWDQKDQRSLLLELVLGGIGAADAKDIVSGLL